MDDKYILVIGDECIDDSLNHYFKAFNIGIDVHSDLKDLSAVEHSPVAIIINWCALQNPLGKIKHIHDHYSIPLLLILEETDESDPVDILNAGADDVLKMPVLPRELHARINAINRRFVHSLSTPSKEKISYHFDNWQLIPSSRQVLDNNKQELQLSANEYDLLYSFIQQPYQVLTRDYLSSVCQQASESALDRRIDIQISRLRQKIDRQKNRKSSLIKTIRNGGYSFCAKVTKKKL